MKCMFVNRTNKVIVHVFVYLEHQIVSNSDLNFILPVAINYNAEHK